MFIFHTSNYFKPPIPSPMSLIPSHSPPCLQLEEPRHLDCLQNSGAHGPTFTWTTLTACPMDLPVGGTQLPGDTSGVLSRCYCWWIGFVASMILNMAWWSVAGGQLLCWMSSLDSIEALSCSQVQVAHKCTQVSKTWGMSWHIFACGGVSKFRLQESSRRYLIQADNKFDIRVQIIIYK